MVPDWPAGLRRQLQALLDTFLNDPPALIGTSSIALLAGASSIRGGVRVQTLGDYPLARAFVLVRGAEPELWVDPDDNSYRDIYRRFARERLGVTEALEGDRFNFDHMFPRTAGALDGLSHVRMIAIAPRPNQAAGRTVEKRMAQRARAQPGRKILRSATWMTIGKAAGYEHWESLPADSQGGNAAAVAALFAHLASIGIQPPAGEIEIAATAHTLGRIR